MFKKKLWLKIKRIYVIAICSLPVYSFAEIKPTKVAIDIGESHDNIDIYRIGLQQEFSNWLDEKGIPLGGYWEASFNYWDGQQTDLYGLFLAPVLFYQFCDSCRLSPYIEAGIGGGFINKKEMDNKDMSTHFQFEERIGVGVKMGRFDLNLRYMHYSNAGMKSPNPGMDIYLLGVSYQF
ncbi:acyloxyacyl hydrolase [Psychromonas sp. MME2]|uniref:acyloxyacyl hydrolase n=1 Tax=unclassified Psychromonas TaxID=2614957 RepID=UPI00339D1D41